MRFLLIFLFLFLILITVFRLFPPTSPKPPNSPKPFQPAYLRLSKPTNFIDQTVKTLYPQPQASLLSGILVGTKANIPKDFYNNLVKTATLHITALSGQNISLLIGFITFLFRPLGKKIASFITIITIIIFILFVGPSPSVVRAGIMGSLLMLSLIFGRQDLSIVSLFLTGMVMVLISPTLIFDLGFQLSFSATLGILLLISSGAKAVAGGADGRAPDSAQLSTSTDGRETRDRTRRSVLVGIFVDLFSTLKKSLFLTLSAQLFTLPIILHNFGNLSLVAPLTNVLVLWTVPILMAGGFVVVFVSLLTFGLLNFLSWFLLPLLNWFILVVNLTASLPWSSTKIEQFPLWLAFLYYAILFFLLGFFHLKP